MLFPPGKPHHCPLSDVYYCIWYLLDPKVTRSLVIRLGPKSQTSFLCGLNEDPSDSECSALIHFSKSLARKQAYLKDSHDQNIKEQISTKNIKKKKKTGFTWNPHLHRHSVQKVYFKFNPLIVVLPFQRIYKNPRSGSTRGKLNLIWPLKPLNHKPQGQILS